MKAVKADDAEVPVYLWDREIIGDNPSERKKRTMDRFRQLGLWWFWCTLFRDCLHQLRTKFGESCELMDISTPSGKLTVRVRAWEFLPLRTPSGWERKRKL